MSSTAHRFPSCPVAFLDGIMQGMRAIVAAEAARNRALAPLLCLVWAYLGRAAPRLERLIARWRAGHLPPPRPPGTSGAATGARLSHPDTPRPGSTRTRLPGRHAWLIRLVQPTAQLAPHLQALLALPVIAELLAAAPQAGRILRPLCRMVGMHPLPPILRRPPIPRRPVPSAEAAPTVTRRPRRCPPGAELPAPPAPRGIAPALPSGRFSPA